MCVTSLFVGGGFPDRQQLRAVIDIGYSSLIGIICAVQHQRCWVTDAPLAILTVNTILYGFEI